MRVGARSCPHCGSTVSTRRCPACLAWNLGGAEHCQGCGASLGAEERPATAETLACPRCAARLSARSYAELEVEECDQCGGLFLTPAMVDRAVKSRDRPAGLRWALPQPERLVERAVQYVHCPVCTKLMNRRAFGRISGVVVDVCRSHGVWFDAGELTEVIRFVERGGLERAREREQADQNERARALHARQWQLDGELPPSSEPADSFVDALWRLWMP